MYTIRCDVRTTRRVVHHVIVNEQGTVEYRANSFGDALAYVVAEGSDVIRIDDGNRIWRVSIAELP